LIRAGGKTRLSGRKPRTERIGPLSKTIRWPGLGCDAPQLGSIRPAGCAPVVLHAVAVAMATSGDD
jgi:hypothetical protein